MHDTDAISAPALASKDDAGFRHTPALSGRAAALTSRFEAIPFSPWHRRARIVMGSATFLDAFDALSLAFVLPILIRLWGMTPAQVGMLIAASYVGQLVGALVFSRLAETFGRVHMAATATVLMSVMSLACALTGNFWMLFTCRLIQGVGVGGEMPVAATYISELLRAKGRGRNFMLYEMIFPIGLMMTGQVGTILVPLLGWKSLFLLGGIPGLVVAYLLYRLPESPRWLISKGRYDEAEKIIADAETSAAHKGFQPVPVSEPVAAQPEPRQDSAPSANEPNPWLEVIGSVFRGRTLIAWSLWASAFFVANSLNNWMPTLYHTIYELDLHTALRAASMTNVAQVAILLVCAFCIDRIGRRAWAVASFLIGAVLFLGLYAGGAGSVWSLVVLATLAYGVVGSINAVLYLYTPEIYPTRMRAVGTGLATSWLRIASAVGPTIVGFMVGAQGVQGVFLMFAVVAAIGAVAATQMIETGGRQLEDIAP
ncbi:MFS transporter [Brucella anthropi]|uniref:MFS transporter n=1 Tax=Brucella anthropi TaxID=529 RepID=UPI00124DCFE9|nr:MFS transporter [Brucella anthropi]KAB2784180.1 MFS transporter [Brucella anthropi]KAB2793110.1 MFS transporter [Brucella anthropi]